MKTQFVEALGKLEARRELEPLVALFAEDAEISNLVAAEKFYGIDGARSFWSKYRDTFDAIESVFANQIEADGRIALEWTTTASTAAGHKVRYEGVSILEVQGGKIKRFSAYFDSAALGRQLETGGRAAAAAGTDK